MQTLSATVCQPDFTRGTITMASVFIHLWPPLTVLSSLTAHTLSTSLHSTYKEKSTLGDLLQPT